MVTREYATPPIDRYQRMQHWLQYPHFESQDQAHEQIELQDGEYQFFVVRHRLGFYDIYRAYLQRGEMTSQRDFSFSHYEMLQERRRAIMATGEQHFLGELHQDFDERAEN